MRSFQESVLIVSVVAGLSLSPLTLRSQGRPDPTALLAAQRTSMEPLVVLDGAWRGPATITMPSGETQAFTQTERVGPFLDGTVRVIEGRGYDADGKSIFNAFAVVSYAPDTKTYSLRSYQDAENLHAFA